MSVQHLSSPQVHDILAACAELGVLKPGEEARGEGARAISRPPNPFSSWRSASTILFRLLSCGGAAREARRQQHRHETHSYTRGTAR